MTRPLHFRRFTMGLRVSESWPHVCKAPQGVRLGSSLKLGTAKFSYYFKNVAEHRITVQEYLWHVVGQLQRGLFRIQKQMF